MRKVKRVGALYGGREPGRIEMNLRVPGASDCKVWRVEGRKGAKDERDVPRGDPEGIPERLKSPREQKPPPRRKLPGSG